MLMNYEFAMHSRLGRMSSVHTLATTPISEAEVGGTSPGGFENQQLLLDEYGFRHHGPHAARTGKTATVARRWRTRATRSRMAQS
jgi:hypothetical protein